MNVTLHSTILLFPALAVLPGLACVQEDFSLKTPVQGRIVTSSDIYPPIINSSNISYGETYNYQYAIDLSGKEEKSFYIPNEVISLDAASISYASVPCYKLKETSHGSFWIQADRTVQGYIDSIHYLGLLFDEYIYSVITENFAPFSDVDENDKIYICFVEFPTALSTLVGYFDPIQLFAYSESIQGEVVYINLSAIETLMQAYTPSLDMIKTQVGPEIGAYLVHELQHACYLNQNGIIEAGINTNLMDFSQIMDALFPEGQRNDTWMDEGLSMMAMLLFGGYGAISTHWKYYDIDATLCQLYGYPVDTEACFDLPVIRIKNGYPMISFWNLAYDYSLATMFYLYLFTHSEDASLFSALLTHEAEDGTNILAAAQACGLIEASNGIPDMQELMGNWLLANFLLEDDGLYGYKGMIYNEWWSGSSGYRGPYYSNLRDNTELYPGGALYFPLKEDAGFTVEAVDGIGYLGYDLETSMVDWNPEDGITGNLLIIFNYSSNPHAEPISVELPNDAMIL